ncbi:histidine phosphatase family protein [Kutzneria sp. CA-103260]|uniref:histidine phosphatase family protein n=1 Tax=Kutzneria sp. CA-103260 TaxID=2802641 RepID=UPI001BAC9189|nr:histidine phosphatase family protein [Kutzneria sp. CA-103260]QUQ63270.1 Histidine phosphatase superfamily (branch 1) [Kutzneria sp. CA-103260]
MRLLLVRHAESLAMTRNLTVSNDNCPGLTSVGFDQARELGRRLDVRPDVLVRSPVTRARQTADELIAALRPPRTEIDRDLAEVDIDEPWNGFLSRVDNVLTTWPERYAGQTVMAVTHAGFMVWVFMTLFGVPRPGTGARVDFDFASVTEWQFSGGWRLVSLNLT